MYKTDIEKKRKKLLEDKKIVKQHIKYAKIGYNESIIGKDKMQFKKWFNELQQELKSLNKRITLIDNYEDGA
jgi:hypothetical protein